MDFRTITNITTPVGDLVRIRRKTDNKIIWEKNTGIEMKASISSPTRPVYWGINTSKITKGKTYTLEFKNKDFDFYTVYIESQYDEEGGFLRGSFRDGGTYLKGDNDQVISYLSGEITDMGIVKTSSTYRVRKLHLKNVVFTFTLSQQKTLIIYDTMGTTWSTRYTTMHNMLLPYVQDNIDDYNLILKEV